MENINGKIILYVFRCLNCNKENKITIEDKPKHCLSCDELLFEVEKTNGFVYVLSNIAIPNLYKIGFTQTSVDKRLIELNAPTSMPEKFEIELIFACNNPQNIERDVHNELNLFRNNSKREFFNAPMKTIYKLLHQKIAKEPIYTRFKNTSVDFLEKYNPWQMDEKIKKRNKTQFICPRCNNTTRNHHQNMNRNAFYYCKLCKINYNSNGFII